MKQHYHGFWIEKRGSNFYGFCDYGCKPIVRANFHMCVSAMNRHDWEHGGQTSLLTDKAEIPSDPKAAPGFPF